MREIKFRGKDVITGNWAYGYYYPSKGHSIVRDENDNECIVANETVGQFTGLKDKNGKEIYERDILKVGVRLIMSVEYIGNNSDEQGDEVSCAFHLCRKGKQIPFDSYAKENCFIIGNIYENKNLLTPTVSSIDTERK